MNTFKKLRDEILAHLNKFLDKIEDPKKLHDLEKLESKVVSKEDAFDTFSRMEEKIDMTEKEIAAPKKRKVKASKKKL